MAEIPITPLDTAGLPQYISASAGGDEFENDGQTVIVCQNSGSDKRIKITGQTACNRGVTDHGAEDEWNNPGAAQITFSTTFDPRFFNVRTGSQQGKAVITYPDGESGLSVAAVRFTVRGAP